MTDLVQTAFFIDSGKLGGSVLVQPAGNSQPASGAGSGFRGTIVLLHNGFDSRRSWQAVASILAGQGWQVVSYDRAGYGESWHPATLPPTQGDMVAHGRDELAGVLASPELARALEYPLSAGPLVLAGHCMGGAIALDHALAFPGRVSALVLEAVGFRSTPAIRRRTDWVLQPWDCLDPALQEHLAGMHGPNAAQSWDHIHRHRSSYVMHAGYDLFDRLGSLGCPTLVLQGDRDFYFDLETAQEACQCLPRGHLAHLPGLGHDLHARHPQDFLARLMPFLDSQVPLPAAAGPC